MSSNRNPFFIAKGHVDANEHGGTEIILNTLSVQAQSLIKTFIRGRDCDLFDEELEGNLADSLNLIAAWSKDYKNAVSMLTQNKEQEEPKPAEVVDMENWKADNGGRFANLEID